jgi:hypothetical protein
MTPNQPLHQRLLGLFPLSQLSSRRMTIPRCSSTLLIQTRRLIEVSWVQSSALPYDPSNDPSGALDTRD